MELITVPFHILTPRDLLEERLLAVERGRDSAKL